MSVEAIFSEKKAFEDGFKKAEEMLKESMIKIDQEDFINHFGKASIISDQKYVRKAEEYFKEKATEEEIQSKQISLILEAIFHENAEMSDWLGPDAMTIKTSVYDDYKNGIDTVAEFSRIEEVSEYLGLAIDVTFSSDVRNKFARIKEEIRKGVLAEVKYFQYTETKTGEEKFILRNIPRVIIGADIRTVSELNELWLNNKKKELGRHWVQFQILEEIMNQLDAFEEYAEQAGQPEIAEKYSKVNEIISKIYDEKQETIEGSQKRDTLYGEIKHQTENFSKFH